MFEDRSSLSIKLFALFVRLRMMAEPAELRPKLASDGRGKHRDQNSDDPILPDLIIRPQNTPDMRYQRLADGS